VCRNRSEFGTDGSLAGKLLEGNRISAGGFAFIAS